MNYTLSKSLFRGKWGGLFAAFALSVYAGDASGGILSSDSKAAINFEYKAKEYAEHTWFEPLYEMTSEWVMRDKVKELFEKQHIIPAKSWKMIEEDNIAKVKELLAQDIKINERDKYDRTALMIAVKIQLGAVDIVKLLLKNNSHVNVKDKDGQTPLMLAAAQANENMVDLLLKNGADVGVADKNGETAIIYAIDQTYSNPIKVVELLEEKGIDINAKSKDGDPLLMLAVKRGHIDVVRFILNKLDKEKDKVLDLLNARKNKHRISGEYLERQTKEEAVNFRSKGGETPLTIAAESNWHPDMVELLIKNGADINAVGLTDMTALMVAAERGNSNTVELLLKYGADVNIEDHFGRTALSFAEDHGHTKVVEILKEAGAKEQS